MSDTPSRGHDNGNAGRRLKDVVRLVRERQAEHDDVVVEMKEAERARLQMLADELISVYEDLDPNDDRFDLTLSKGEKPRLWIDMVSFVAMGHDKRTYRLIRDSRAGRLVLAETEDTSKAVDLVTEYIAERVVERERMIEGDSELAARPAIVSKYAAKPPGRKRRAFFWFFTGAAAMLLAIVATAFILVPDAF